LLNIHQVSAKCLRLHFEIGPSARCRCAVETIIFIVPASR
jgi:hypothetical protein